MLINKIKTVLQLLLLFAVASIFVSCARRGRPKGGPEDKEKPIMVKAKPDFGSVHFTDDEIKIYFDEYIKLKDLNKQLIISPPLKYPPVIMPQGTPSKFITIRLQDTLKENTTYTFNFGSSIIDNTEGNVLENFKYVVSTGDYIDSLAVRGTVKDAYLLERDENVILLLYPYNEEYTDSVIYKQKPMYVGSLTDSINFEITNIKEGKYMLRGMVDRSKNYVYNQREDKIGFYPDVIDVPTDSGKVFNIVLFKEIPPFRLPKKPLQESKGKILFAYEGNADSIQIVEYPRDPEMIHFINREKAKDTLNYWYDHYEKDSIRFIVRNRNFIDTLTVKLRKDKMDSLRLSSGTQGTLNLRDTLNLLSNTPVIKIDTSKIYFIDADSSRVEYTYKQNAAKDEIYLFFEKKYNEKYQIHIFPGATTDFFGVENDTLKLGFGTKRPANYSSVFLTLLNINNYPVIVDLINDRGSVEASYYAEKEGEIRFENISPSRYMVRVIYDANHNRKWDTGDYFKKIQPEKVYYFSNVIEAKANWEVVEKFIMQ